MCILINFLKLSPESQLPWYPVKSGALFLKGAKPAPPWGLPQVLPTMVPFCTDVTSSETPALTIPPEVALFYLTLFFIALL